MCQSSRDYTEQIWDVLKDLREMYQWNNQCKIIQIISYDDGDGILALDSDGRIWRCIKDDEGKWKQLRVPDLNKKEK